MEFCPACLDTTTRSPLLDGTHGSTFAADLKHEAVLKILGKKMRELNFRFIVDSNWEDVIAQKAKTREQRCRLTSTIVKIELHSSTPLSIGGKSIRCCMSLRPRSILDIFSVVNRLTVSRPSDIPST